MPSPNANLQSVSAIHETRPGGTGSVSMFSGETIHKSFLFGSVGKCSKHHNSSNPVNKFMVVAKSATKSNALRHAMVMWDEVADIVAKDYPQVEYRKYHVDAIAARMVTNPASLDVIVCSNLFGDILTDIGSAISGSLGIAPGANINPERTFPSMFEPIHGSAPDIAGKGIANPIGAIWAAAQMFDHLGHRDVHDKILGAVERVLASGTGRTPDLGGAATTAELSAAIVSEI